ncbi:MAG: hypothetical protein U0269_32415 [Polyangiales bacterium]
MRVTRWALVLCSLALLGAGTDTNSRGTGARPRPTPSQSCATWRNLASRRWAGRWNDSDGWRFTFELSLRRQANNVSGEFVWTLAATQDPSMTRRIGDSAIERVRGTVDCASGTLSLAGYAVTDATLIARDAYELSFGSSGALSGRTRGNDDRWDGVLVATPR